MKRVWMLLFVVALAAVAMAQVYREPGVSEMPTDTANVTISWNAKSTKAGNWTTAQNTAARSHALAFTQGTGAGQINRVIHDTLTINPGGSETFDFRNFTDLFNGTGAEMDTLRVVYISHVGTVAGGTEAALELEGFGAGEELPWSGAETNRYEIQDVMIWVSWDSGWSIEPTNHRITFSNPSLEGNPGTIEYFFAGVKD